MAVPYRAAHTPSERSEFAQPDVALLLTHLSYYYDGLSYNEFMAAIEVLLGLGLNAQRDYYEDWLRMARHGIPPGGLLAVFGGYWRLLAMISNCCRLLAILSNDLNRSSAFGIITDPLFEILGRGPNLSDGLHEWQTVTEGRGEQL